METKDPAIAVETPAHTAREFIKKRLEITPEEKRSLTDYDFGYRSSSVAINSQLTDEISINEIHTICTAERKKIIDDIDKRIKGTEVSRKDEMTLWERGYLHGANDVMYCF